MTDEESLTLFTSYTVYNTCAVPLGEVVYTEASKSVARPKLGELECGMGNVLLAAIGILALRLVDAP